MKKAGELKWLLVEAVLAFHRMVISEFGGLSGIRDEGLLESALARPKNLHHYEESPDLFDLAASYAFGIAKNHPFVDGNKRVSFLSAIVFLDINDVDFLADEAESVVVFEGLASGRIGEAELSAWLRDKSVEAKR